MRYGTFHPSLEHFVLKETEVMPNDLSNALLNSLSTPIVAIDKRGRILTLNEAARQLLPAGDPEPLGADARAIFPALSSILKDIKTHREGFRGEIALDPTHVAEISVTPIPSQGWAIALHDVSRYKEVEARKNNLLGEVTHDLKQPLAAILSFSDIVQASVDLNSKQAQYLDRVRSAASRMSEQVHQLLDVVWIEAGMRLTLVEVDLANLVKTTLDDLESKAAAKKIALVFKAPPEVPTLVADGVRLGQVVANLINNAIKYSATETRIVTSITSNKRSCVLSVKDQGIGIAPAHLPNLFQRFYRVQDKQTRKIEGTGLGLYISRSIVEQHGGHITAESEPGKGSIFTVYLPQHPSPERASLEHSTSA